MRVLPNIYTTTACAASGIMFLPGLALVDCICRISHWNVIYIYILATIAWQWRADDTIPAVLDNRIDQALDQLRRSTERGVEWARSQHVYNATFRGKVNNLLRADIGADGVKAFFDASREADMQLQDFPE